MEEFYLTEILSKEKTNQETIIDILKARGFLIDYIDGHYYLSDNATVDDAQYLKDSLGKYDLGIVIDNEEYITRSRRIWNKHSLARSYEYKALKPYSVEIIVNKNASIESAIEFFNSTGRFSEDCISFILSWNQYAVEELGPKADVSHLESYIAYYVKAVSSCGVYTCRSCDGNHPNGGRIIVESEYPSNVWHWYIWKYIVQPQFGPLPYIGNDIPFDAYNQRIIYSQVYRIADFLYMNRGKIRAMKRKTVEHINTQYLRKHREDEIEAFYRVECERVMRSDAGIIVK